LLGDRRPVEKLQYAAHRREGADLGEIDASQGLRPRRQRGFARRRVVMVWLLRTVEHDRRYHAGASNSKDRPEKRNP
jgi:hypothetical protein